MKKQVALAVLLVAAMANAAVAVPAANVTGKWDFSVETPMGSGSPKFEFKQDGETLTGSYEGQLGQAKVTGTVKGNDITFKFSVDLGEIVYSGVIQEDGSMKGKVKLGDSDGTFTAKKAGK